MGEDDAGPSWPGRLLEAHDGDERDYSDIAEVLPEVGAAVQADLSELFARVVFNVAVHNTDDHLRNHGFVRRSGGRVLSPVFDMNPNPDIAGVRATSVLGAVEAGAEIEALSRLAPSCRLSKTQALVIVGRVVAAVQTWRTVAAANGIPARELSLFAHAIDSQVAALADLHASL